LGVRTIKHRALRALFERIAELPPYPTAGGLAVLALCLAETVVVPGQRPLVYFVQLLALALPLGVLVGTLLACLLLAGERVSAWHRAFTPWVIWPLVGSAAGAGLASVLGAFTRLGTHYDSLAKATLGGSIAGGIGVGLLLASLQPTPRYRFGYLTACSPFVRASATLVLVGGATVLSYADHTLYIGLYIAAHVTLRFVAALLITSALAISAVELLLPVLRKRAAYAVAALILLPLATLDEQDSDVVQALVIRPWPATALRAARSTFDLDRDGFSYVLGGGDCNDFDRAVNPGAREVPGNGVDDNCLFGDRPKVVTVAAPPPVPKEPSPLSVVLITMDTLRRDRFGGIEPAFGKRGRNTMPNVERFAKGGVVFRNAFTSGAWTSIAIGTLMRGMHARRMTWTRYYEVTSYRMVKSPIEGKLAPHEAPAKMFPLAFDDPHDSLPQLLKRRGMRTLAVVDDGFSQMLSSTVGIGRGFDVYREVNVEPVTLEEAIREQKLGRRTTRDDATTASFALAELRKYGEKKEPFFLWVHFFGAHTPTRTHAGAPKYGATLEDGYDHEVRFVDLQVERVLAAIRKLDRKVAVFLTSDHGEAFFKRYRSHGADMSDDVLAIPLIAQVPGWKSQEIETPVSLVDVMPTVLGVTGTPAPSGLDGIDLARLVHGEKLPGRVLLSDTWQFANDSKPFSELVAAFDGKHKVVLDRMDHSFSVYDQTDPEAPPLRIDGLANGKLARSILAYLEDTGGQLNVVDGPPDPVKPDPPAKPPAPPPAEKPAKKKAKAKRDK
jgi:arylsulfatase A-like enzyme